MNYEYIYVPIIILLIITCIIALCCFFKKNNSRPNSDIQETPSELEEVSNLNENMNIYNIESTVPYITYTLNSENENDCTICFDTMNNTKVVQLNCLHKFHESCLKEWWDSDRGNKQKNCPICGEIKIGIV